VKVVVDTNVLVSGIFWGGKPGIVLQYWRTGKIDMLATVEILEEYLRVITKIGKHEPELIELWTGFLLQHLIIIEKNTTLKTCRDPDDNMFLECVASATADCLVSGDDDLIVLENIRGIPILSASKFLSTYFKKLR
jgi:putative PIN family toxin of toxin-antitoxin system